MSADSHSRLTFDGITHVQQDVGRHARMTRKRMVVGGSVANASSKHDANQQPVHAAFYAGFPDFQVEVAPLKVRKDGEKFKLAHENAAVAHAKWNAGAPVQANKNWNNIRVLQTFGGSESAQRVRTRPDTVTMSPTRRAIMHPQNLVREEIQIPR